MQSPLVVGVDVHRKDNHFHCLDPTGQTIGEGRSAHFTVTATGVGPLSYEWFRNSMFFPQGTTTPLALYGILQATVAEKKPKRKLSFMEQKDYDAMEGKILEAEEKVQACHKKMEDPKVLANGAQLTAACDEMHVAQEAVAAVDEALVLVTTTSESWAAAELHRIRGDLLMDQSKSGLALASYEQALGIARQQQARAWERRILASQAAAS